MNCRVPSASPIVSPCCTTAHSSLSEQKMRSETVSIHEYGSSLTGFRTRWGNPLKWQPLSENICEARRQVYDNGSKSWRFRPRISTDPDIDGCLSGKRTVSRRQGVLPNLLTLCGRA